MPRGELIGRGSCSRGGGELFEEIRSVLFDWILCVHVVLVLVVHSCVWGLFHLGCLCFPRNASYNSFTDLKMELPGNGTVPVMRNLWDRAKERGLNLCGIVLTSVYNWCLRQEEGESWAGFSLRRKDKLHLNKFHTARAVSHTLVCMVFVCSKFCTFSHKYRRFETNYKLVWKFLQLQ